MRSIDETRERFSQSRRQRKRDRKREDSILSQALEVVDRTVSSKEQGVSRTEVVKRGIETRGNELRNNTNCFDEEDDEPVNTASYSEIRCDSHVDDDRISVSHVGCRIPPLGNPTSHSLSFSPLFQLAVQLYSNSLLKFLYLVSDPLHVSFILRERLTALDESM